MKRDHTFLKLDLDGYDCVDLQDIEFKLGRAGYTISELIHVAHSPSGNGFHVVIDVSPRPKCPYEVVALQAICGSDKNREAMQMNRARGYWSAPRWMRDAWNVLYRPSNKRQRHLNLRDC